MCTAISYTSGDFYFGRNLDLDITYGEKVTVMPRNFQFPMRCMPDLTEHYAVIGMAVISKGYPLFFDATNEKGLSVAGLNFPGNAFFKDYSPNKDNVTPFELIPWILGSCADTKEAKELTKKLNLVNIPFSDELPLSPLHWIISDRYGSLTLESTKEGLKIYSNPWGVLANNPPFDYHLINTERFLLYKEPLPGDFSSEARFLRAAYLKEKASAKKSEEERVSQLFRMLSLVSVPEGCVTKNGKAHYTRYTSCCNADKGIYYYNRCEKYATEKLSIRDFDLNGYELLPLEKKEKDCYN